MTGHICPPSFPILSAWAYEFSFQKSTREAPVSVCLERYSLENPVSVMSCFFPWAAIAVDMSPSTAVRSVAGVLIPSLQKGVNARNPSRLARTASPDGFLNSSHEHVNIRGAPQWNKCLFLNWINQIFQHNYFRVQWNSFQTCYTVTFRYTLITTHPVVHIHLPLWVIVPVDMFVQDHRNPVYRAFAWRFTCATYFRHISSLFQYSPITARFSRLWGSFSLRISDFRPVRMCWICAEVIIS